MSEKTIPVTIPKPDKLTGLRRKHPVPVLSDTVLAGLVAYLLRTESSNSPNGNSDGTTTEE